MVQNPHAPGSGEPPSVKDLAEDSSYELIDGSHGPTESDNHAWNVENDAYDHQEEGW